MKALKLKRFFFILIATVAVALFTATLAVGLLGTETSNPAAAADSPRIVLSSNPTGLSNGNPNQEFTINVRIEGVASVAEGLYGAEVVLIPDQASSLDFVRFVPSKDVTQSATNGESKHLQGISVTMEGNNSGNPFITKDFNVGGFTFKLKQGVSAPSTGLTFKCEDSASATSLGSALKMATSTFTLNFRDAETSNTLSALSISNGNTQLISGTDDEQTISDIIDYNDRKNIKISATRDGQYSKIKVVDSVGNKTLVSEKGSNLSNQTLGELDPGEHTITITVTPESGEPKTYTIKLTVGEAPGTPVAKPVAPATTESGYTGSAIDFTPAGMADLVSSGKVKLYAVSDSGTETEVGIDAFKPTNPGNYKIVARPAAGYSWDGSDKTDPEYSFKVNKATLTAKDAGEGKLPTFSSDSYKGSLDDIIDYKYYTDEACTQEIPKSELTPGQTYYAKPSLKPGAEANFEFDEDSVTQTFVNNGASFVAQEEGNFLTKKYFGLPLWVWLIIALLVLLFIILLIIFIVKRRKKDDDEQKNKNGENTANGGWQTQPVGVGAAMGAVAADSAFAAKTDRIEDRMREMEHEAHEREITRYREEAERAKRDAEFKNMNSNTPQQPAMGMAAATVAADAALASKTERIEDRMREIERDAHEREIARYREEVERAKREAELKNMNSNIPQQPAMGMAAATVAADVALASKTERIEDRMREIERDAHEREIARYREEVERIKRDAELKNTVAMAQQPVAAAATVMPDGTTNMRIAQLEEEMRRYEENLRNEMRKQEDAQRDSERRLSEERIAKMKADAEREIERMKEEARRLTTGSENQPQAATAAASVASAEMLARIAQIEENMRRREEEMRNELRRQEDAQRDAERRSAEERIAKMKADAEREVERMKEEARRAANTANQPQNTAAVAASTEMIARLAQLEETMKRREEEMRNEMRKQEDAQRELERKNAEERIAKMREDAEREAERIKAEAERMREEARRASEASKQTQAQPVATAATAEMTARLAQLEETMKRREEEMRNEMRKQEDARREAERREAEERIAKMKADAEREAERIKADAERIKEEARRSAEDIKRQNEIRASVQQPVVPVVTTRLHTTEVADMDAETAAVLRDYQDRMRKMEQELQEQRMTNLMRENTEKARKEMEEASKMRRHEEEMQRLRDLQDYERRQRQEMQNMQNMPYMQPFMQPYMQQQPYGQFSMSDSFMRQQQELEAQRLKLLEERLKQREMEVQMLRSQGFGAPQQPYVAQQPYGAQPYAQPYPPQYPPYGQPQGYAPVQPNPMNPMGDKK